MMDASEFAALFQNILEPAPADPERLAMLWAIARTDGSTSAVTSELGLPASWTAAIERALGALDGSLVVETEDGKRAITSAGREALTAHGLDTEAVSR